MTVKELKEKLAALPKEADGAKVYVYSNIDEGGDDARRLTLYDKDYDFDFHGTPYCRGDEPWAFHRNDEGRYICSPEGYKKNAPFIIIS